MHNRIRREVEMVKIDEDLKKMTVRELQQEVMRYRRAFEQEANHTGNHRCWITLEEARTGKVVKLISMDEKSFLSNCRRYYRRNSGGKADHFLKVYPKMKAAMEKGLRKLKKKQKKQSRRNMESFVKEICENCRDEKVVGIACIRCGHTGTRIFS